MQCKWTQVQPSILRTRAEGKEPFKINSPGEIDNDVIRPDNTISLELVSDLKHIKDDGIEYVDYPRGNKFN